MTYEHPEIHLLGDATNLIQGKMAVVQEDGSRTEQSAYDLDE
jgi:hypothetical protein